MTERERLIGLLEQAKENATGTIGSLNNGFGAWYADYLLANGVKCTPCKVGDACYPLWNSRNKPIVERKISRITYSARNIIIGYYENDGQYRPPLRTRILGEDVFLSREEAEKALAERR